MRLRMPPMFLCRRLLVDERLAAHLDIDLLHLPSEPVPDISRNALVFLQRSLDCVHGRLHLPRFFLRVFFDLPAQLPEERLLIVQQTCGAPRAVA